MVDLSFLKQFTKGDEGKMKRYIKMYLKIAPSIFNQMEEDIKNKDWARLSINAHSLKPQADYMGVAELKEVLINIETNVNNGDYDQLENLYNSAKEKHIEAAGLLSKHVG